MNAMEMESAMIGYEAAQQVAMMLGRDLIAYKNKENENFKIEKWDWGGVEYDQGDQHVQVYIERYCCGDTDREWINIPFEWFDMKREDIYTIIDKEREEKKRIEKERVEAMKKQMEEETLAGERRLYESLKRKFENV
jgi:hypothetical protein